MTDHILKKAMPGLHASMNDPTNEQAFRNAMEVLEEALDEEDRFSSGNPMWHAIENLDVSPHPTREHVKDWVKGKNYPKNPFVVVQKIFNHLRKHGVELPEPTAVRRQRQMKELEDEHITTDHGASSVQASPQEQAQTNELVQRMQSVGYHGLLAELLAWTSRAPLGFAMAMKSTIECIPQEILEPLIRKIAGLNIGWMQAWALAPSDPQLAANAQWPTPEEQARIVKHVIAFLLRIELHTKVTEPTVLAVRIKIAARLFDEADWAALTERVRNHKHAQGRWDGFTVDYLQGLINDTAAAPQDEVLAFAIQNEMIRTLKPRLKEGRWP